MSDNSHSCCCWPELSCHEGNGSRLSENSQRRHLDVCYCVPGQEVNATNALVLFCFKKKKDFKSQGNKFESKVF